jgi:glycine cleavage system transcriptional repressor
VAEYAVTVIGADRPGIVAAVTAALAEVGGNLTDSDMSILRGHFAMTLVVDAAVDVAAVRAALTPVGARLGVVCSAAEVSPVEASVPGIVAAVTEVLARHGANITDLTTRLTGELYVLVCDVDVPASVNAAGLDEELRAVASRVGVDAALRPVDTDLL